VPEILEIEAYRRLAVQVVGRTVRSVQAPDAWFIKGGATPESLSAALVGRRFTAARRLGKLLLLDSGGPTLGLRFGMTGRLLVDGQAAIEHLEWGSRRFNPAWHRFGLTFTGGGQLIIDDPRRFGGVEIAPDETALGPDAWTLGVGGLRQALSGGRGPLKARLLDQSRIAGLGNLLVDEMCWRASLDPHRPAGSLSDQESKVLARVMRQVLNQLDKRGGSHMGELFEHRHPGACCPQEGEPLVKATIGGRTTWWCPQHQQ
jgi:formamidopyrimidine-DNA glycosylase